MDEHMLSAFMRPFRFIVFALALTSGCVAFAGEIHKAVHENDVSKVKKLIAENPDLVFSKDKDGFTPLHLAAANGYKEMAEMLLASKSDVNSRDNAESTPLHQAAAPWRPIRVSPIAFGRFFSQQGYLILKNELLWIWLPAGLFAVLVLMLRRPERAAATAAN